MKIQGRTWMSIGLMLISVGVFVTALGWPAKSAIFPISIAVVVFILAAIEVFLSLYLKRTAKETSTMDFKLANAEDLDIDEATARKRVVILWVWMMAFFALILLVGFPAAIPIFCIAFLRIYGKEGWKLTLILTAVAWGFFYILFIRIIHTPFADGWILDGLKALGILS